MARNENLHLHEKLLLLVLRDEKGTVESGASMYHLALGGAILSELLLAGAVRIDESSKQKLVDFAEGRSMRDPVLDECLGLVASAKRRRRASAWVARFANVKRLRHRIAEGLCDRGILKQTEDKVLFVFSRTIYPTVDPRPEKRLLESMRRAIFSEARELDPDVVILVALAHGTGMLRVHFDRKRLKERKRRLEEIAEGSLAAAAAGEAVRAAQQAMQAAVMAAILASTAASAASC